MSQCINILQRKHAAITCYNYKRYIYVRVPLTRAIDINNPEHGNYIGKAGHMYTLIIRTKVWAMKRWQQKIKHLKEILERSIAYVILS